MGTEKNRAKRARKRQPKPVEEHQQQTGRPVDLEVGSSPGRVGLRLSVVTNHVALTPQQALDLAVALSQAAKDAIARQRQDQAKLKQVTDLLGGPTELAKLLVKPDQPAS